MQKRLTKKSRIGRDIVSTFIPALHYYAAVIVLRLVKIKLKIFIFTALIMFIHRTTRNLFACLLLIYSSFTSFSQGFSTKKILVNYFAFGNSSQSSQKFQDNGAPPANNASLQNNDVKNHSSGILAHYDCFSGEDFNFERDPCSPYTLKFITTSTAHTFIRWQTGDGTTVQNVNNFVHLYFGAGNYVVKMILGNATCTDTISKVISLNVVKDDIIITSDTIMCAGATKQLRTLPSLKFCWSPASFLDNPNSANPVTSSPNDITYHFTAESIGSSLIVNGDFTNGNTGFTSGYNYTNNNITEGQYFVGTSPKTWNPSLSACVDHTTGQGNMLLLNGSPSPNVELWKETVPVTPNTNYAFSAWIQSLFAINPAQASFSINGKDIGKIITATVPTCNWTQFYVTWNSGNNTSATISIINKNTLVSGNDFAMDDISFAPVLIKEDSVVIRVDKSQVNTGNDTSVCKGATVQLNATGVASYSWTPGIGLSDAGSSKPIATPVVSTKYFVTGVSTNGCSSKDSVTIKLFPFQAVSVSNDTSVCNHSSLQLFAKGGASYQWAPTTSLVNPSTSTPTISPTDNTIYHVLITDNNKCSYQDSVLVTIKPARLYNTFSDSAVCKGSSITLRATGGDKYLWSPASDLDDPSSATPKAAPLLSTTYHVTISDTVCHRDTILAVSIISRQNPVINATSSNDINCAHLTSQLNATGASSYLWSPAEGLSDIAIGNPVASMGVSSLLTVTGTDIYGCKAVDTVSIKVTHDAILSFNLPNAFTPNNDGRNDCFGIGRLGNVEVIQFSVYNRWGQCVFNTKDAAQCWDGTFHGVQQPNDVYVYIVKTKGFCGDVSRKGVVLLIR